MQQRQLGPGGPTVGALGLGAMPLSVRRERPSEEDAVGVLRRAAEVGMTLWDTADAYALDDTEAGHNERLVGKAYALLPADLKAQVVIASKAGQVRPRGEWVANGRPEYIRKAVDASLAALGVDQIGLYQFHRPDPGVPFADSIGAFAEARRQGKVKFVGLSNVSAKQIDEAQAIVVPIASVQNQFSPKHRQPEQRRLPGKVPRTRPSLPALGVPLGGFGGAKSTRPGGHVGRSRGGIGRQSAAGRAGLAARQVRPRNPHPRREPGGQAWRTARAPTRSHSPPTRPPAWTPPLSEVLPLFSQSISRPARPWRPCGGPTAGGRRGGGSSGGRACRKGQGLWLPGVAAVHTVFVRFPLDLLFLDDDFRDRAYRCHSCPTGAAVGPGAGSAAHRWNWVRGRWRAVATSRSGSAGRCTEQTPPAPSVLNSRDAHGRGPGETPALSFP